MNYFFSPNLYRVFRFLLGAYLAVHFIHLIPYVEELFSSNGMLHNGSLSPLFGVIPNVFALSDTPLFVITVTGFAIIASLMFMLGHFDRAAAIFIWFILACYFARNPLITNPALPYLGWLLLAHVFMPKLDVLELKTANEESWQVRRNIFYAAWIILALSYSYSGYTKLLSASWFSGETIGIVLNNPLARDHFLNELILSLPVGYLQLLTWFVLYVELLFAPLSIFKKLRPWLWSAMLFVQVGFLIFLDFADLTIPMLLFHLLTFDARWLAVKHRGLRPEKYVLHYDGECGFCHGLPKFVIEEDKANSFSYTPLQSDFSQSRLSELNLKLESDSIVFQAGTKIYLESGAVIKILQCLGGFWVLPAFILNCIPSYFRNRAYRFIGKHRKRIRQSPVGLCPILPPEYRQRFKLHSSAFSEIIS
jgi:predicted DCC family thiol-disulfide oxidoreductase YuxK